MTRKVVVIDEVTHSILKSRSALAGVTMSELVTKLLLE